MQERGRNGSERKRREGEKRERKSKKKKGRREMRVGTQALCDGTVQKTKHLIIVKYMSPHDRT